MLAGGSHSWQYGPAEEIVAAIGPVDPFPVILGIVEGLAVDFVDGAVLGDCLVEGNGVGIVVDRWVDRQDQGQGHYCKDDCFHQILLLFYLVASNRSRKMKISKNKEYKQQGITIGKSSIKTPYF